MMNRSTKQIYRKGVMMKISRFLISVFIMFSFVNASPFFTWCDLPPTIQVREVVQIFVNNTWFYIGQNDRGHFYFAHYPSDTQITETQSTFAFQILMNELISRTNNDLGGQYED
jgi:hypothetical protein